MRSTPTDTPTLVDHTLAKRRILPPHTWPFRSGDIAAAVTVNALLIIGMWVRHGGISLLGGLDADLTGAGQITALLGTYAALIQILLMSRSPWLERLFGMDRLAHWHRWLGFSCITLICAHVVLTTVGYAVGDGSSIASETWTLLTTYPYVLMATVATGLLIMVAVTSIRRARRRLQYETWHFLHLYTYLAIVLAFGHELAVGTDFSTDPVARVYWIALYVFVAGCVLAFRVGHPLRLALTHQLRIAQTVNEAPGVVSVYMTGRHLDQFRAQAGQFFKWRFLTATDWWRDHPFSLSAAPNGQYLRITIKDVGDGTHATHQLAPGVRVIAEGPYGVFTVSRRTKPRALLVAGGIGITPLRALLEEFPSGKNIVTLLYRARSWDEVVFRDELEELIRNRKGTLYFIVGQRRDLPDDPFSPQALRQYVPDIELRDIFICGSAKLMGTLHDTLKQLHIPKSSVHYERFALL